MSASSYAVRRSAIETYFDRTAAASWSRLTSDAPLGRIRATVRAGRDQMRALMLGWLPDNLVGRRLLDAGCGTGALAIAAAKRGADVVAVDLSPTMVGLARDRSPRDLGAGRLEFRVGDMLQPELGEFDHIIAMDSLIHYPADQVVALLSALTERTRISLFFTFAPRTPALALMHSVGRLFPRADRAPAVEPLGERALRRRLAEAHRLAAWRLARVRRVTCGFYISQAVELARA